jgi:RimJ/RimL family protein N-acetyltransferase
MERQTIPAGWLTLRPFTTADIPWVYEVSLDPEVQHFVQVPSPYRLEDAVYFVENLAIACWDSGQRAEFVAEEAATGTRLGRAGLGLDEAGSAEVGYWVDPRARGRGVATGAVRAICRWAFATLGVELIEWRCEMGNTASRRVAEKAGFLIEATLRKRLVHRGVRVGAWVGSLLRDEGSSGLNRVDVRLARRSAAAPPGRPGWVPAVIGAASVVCGLGATAIVVFATATNINGTFHNSLSRPQITLVALIWVVIGVVNAANALRRLPA